jgi:hypothetical protein
MNGAGDLNTDRIGRRAGSHDKRAGIQPIVACLLLTREQCPLRSRFAQQTAKLTLGGACDCVAIDTVEPV